MKCAIAWVFNGKLGLSIFELDSLYEIGCKLALDLKGVSILDDDGDPFEWLENNGITTEWIVF